MVLLYSRMFDRCAVTRPGSKLWLPGPGPGPGPGPLPPPPAPGPGPMSPEQAVCVRAASASARAPIIKEAEAGPMPFLTTAASGNQAHGGTGELTAKLHSAGWLAEPALVPD